MYLGARKSRLAREIPSLARLYLLWAIGVSLSTLTIKMHYVVDVLGGIAIASFCFYLVGWAIRRFNWYPLEETSYNHEELQNN